LESKEWLSYKHDDRNKCHIELRQKLPLFDLVKLDGHNRLVRIVEAIVRCGRLLVGDQIAVVGLRVRHHEKMADRPP
jgi:hypothetical protein